MMVGRPSNAAHLSIAELCTSHPGTTVVTTNYDTCLEGALGGDAYTYGFEPRATSPSSPSVTRLAKLHGSLNWYSCVNCDRFIAAPLDEVGRAFQAGLYPIISICPSCQATAQQLIVPPIGQKYHDHPMFLNVRRVAEDAFRDAGVVFIVGYSFNEADEYILRMLSRATQEDSDKLFVVLDTDSSPCTRLIKFLQTHVRAFDVKQGVVQILGDASVTVPLLSAAVGRSLHASAEPISLATAS
jgi:NAD-dependent SIR2 family protein deacetylase